jgi:ATP-binding cassette subfamily F protein uup
VLGYLQEFLFSPERARSPVRVFSGGERARLLLAKLFSKPANILVLDEPTNDLDVETLELLEARLVDFAGTVIVISHDREFLDNIATDTLFLDGSGRVREYVGGYSDWRRQGGRFPTELESSAPREPGKGASPRVASAPDSGKATASAAVTEKKPAKLSYKHKRELEQLPGQIEALESQLESLNGQVSAPDFYQQGTEAVNAVLKELANTEASLEQAMERWMELEEMQNGG